MGKKATIVIRLVEESAEKSNEMIEKEILEELSKHPPAIPWLKKVKEVTVKDARAILEQGVLNYRIKYPGTL